MRDWVFPSIAFLIFLYGMFFIGLYIYDYTNSNVGIFSDSNDAPANQNNIDNFLKEISKSFKWKIV